MNAKRLALYRRDTGDREEEVQEQLAQIGEKGFNSGSWTAARSLPPEPLNPGQTGAGRHRH